MLSLASLSEALVGSFCAGLFLIANLCRDLPPLTLGVIGLASDDWASWRNWLANAT